LRHLQVPGRGVQAAQRPHRGGRRDRVRRARGGAVGEDGEIAMQYRIEHIAGWKNPAIIRVKDGVVIGHIYADYEDELKPYLGQGVVVDVSL
jgi:hypothetical protein